MQQLFTDLTDLATWARRHPAAAQELRDLAARLRGNLPQLRDAFRDLTSKLPRPATEKPATKAPAAADRPSLLRLLFGPKRYQVDLVHVDAGQAVRTAAGKRYAEAMDPENETDPVIREEILGKRGARVASAKPRGRGK
jgi:ABC-type transporter Mla subunit MlaD